MNPTRRGASSLELLLAAGAVAALTALGTPWLLSAREAARRTSCAHRLGRLAAAAQDYQAARGVFPPGWTQIRTGAQWGWPVVLLPHVGQHELYERLAAPQRTLGEALQSSAEREVVALLQRPLDAFRCPEDGSPSRHPTRLIHGRQVGSSSYVGVAGFFLRAGADWSATNNGLLYAGSRVAPADVVDGLSRTMLLGERSANGDGHRAAVWAGTSAASADGAHIAGAVGWKLNYPPEVSAYAARRAFASAHPEGGQFAFCDGSVRWLSDAVESSTGKPHVSPTSRSTEAEMTSQAWLRSLGVYQRLGIRNDGQAP